jgi:hypothetical protein
VGFASAATMTAVAQGRALRQIPYQPLPMLGAQAIAFGFRHKSRRTRGDLPTE